VDSSRHTRLVAFAWCGHIYYLWQVIINSAHVDTDEIVTIYVDLH